MEPTPSQTAGPFFGFALPFADGPRADQRSTVRIEGQLLDGAGQPVPDGLVEAWQGDQFARCGTDPEGLFHLLVSRPPAGPDGQAPHLEVTVFARGLLRHLNTRLYFPDEQAANAADPVLQAVDPARRHTLMARSDGGALRFDVRLQGDEETVFFAI
jgi:protocatechuate 3,4-dioxygenase, alpha subunit